MLSEATRPPASPRKPPGWALCALFMIGAWFVATQLAHAFTEAINWDEFALLTRADLTLRLGEVVGGGRPGLVPMLLTVFVRDCVDSVRTVVDARLLWQLLTLAYLAGVYCLVRRWYIAAGRADDGQAQALLAVALLAFLPAFVTWSVQVRTDQAALAAATWGGVLLLSTTYRSAVIAGVLFGIAMLCTQKAAYVIALCGALFATSTAARHLAESRTERGEQRLPLLRLALTVLATIVVIGLYLHLVPSARRLATGVGFVRSLEWMNWVREQLGYRAYTVHSDRLVVHWVLFATLLAWTLWTAIRRDRAEAMVLLTAWLTLCIGWAVVRFHGAGFPYFLMTAGLYPAVALGMSAGGPLAMAGRMAWPTVAALTAFAAIQSAPESIEMLDNTQRIQRDTMQLVHASGLRDRRGYQVEGALFCSRDPDPFPIMFSQDIWRRFQGSSDEAASFISEFRNRPVAYFVTSYRMGQFPSEVRNFWVTHYVSYANALFVAGFNVEPGGVPTDVEVIVPGMYRWHPSSARAPATALVDGVSLRPLETVWLTAGQHRIESRSAATGGILVLSDLPAAARGDEESMYPHRQVEQLRARR